MRNSLLLLLLAGCTAGASTPPVPSAPSTPPASVDAAVTKLPNGYNPMLSFAPLVEQVQPAVVNVYVTTRTAVPAQYQYYMGMPPEQVQKGQGSGFVVTPDGYILTNNHVAGGASDIRVKFESGEEYPAKLIGADAGSDVALLKIDAPQDLPFLKFGDSDAARVGDWVIAVGNPLGLGHTVTAGIISGKGREIPDLEALEEFLQTDAGINPGNSGGPLIGTDGAVLGMNTAIISGANSVAFSIPSAHLQMVMQQLRETGHVARGYLGVGSAPLSARGKRYYKLEHGVVITEVAAGSAASSLGLVPGDVVTDVAGKQIDDPKDLFRAVASKSPGEAVEMKWVREGKPMSGSTSLGTRPVEE